MHVQRQASQCNLMSWDEQNLNKCSRPWCTVSPETAAGRCLNTTSTARLVPLRNARHTLQKHFSLMDGVACYGMLLWHAVIACCYCMLLLHVVIECCYCMPTFAAMHLPCSVPADIVWQEADKRSVSLVFFFSINNQGTLF